MRYKAFILHSDDASPGLTTLMEIANNKFSTQINNLNEWNKILQELYSHLTVKSMSPMPLQTVAHTKAGSSVIMVREDSEWFNMDMFMNTDTYTAISDRDSIYSYHDTTRRKIRIAFKKYIENHEI